MTDDDITQVEDMEESLSEEELRRQKKWYYFRIIVSVAIILVGIVAIGTAIGGVANMVSTGDTNEIMNGSVQSTGGGSQWATRSGDAAKSDGQSVATQSDGWTSEEDAFLTDSGGDFLEVSDVVSDDTFTSTATTPLSTTSADVDTGSYVNLRKSIYSGSFNVDVRVEEMINYFTYDYGKPERGLFSQNVAIMNCPWNENTKLVSLGFATPDYYTFAKDVGSNIVFLVDVSGSMSGEGLPMFQELVADMFKSGQFKATDTLSLVTYASGEEVVFEGLSGSEDKKIVNAVQSLYADGSTNGEAGLRKAYDLLEKYRIEDGVNQIIMVTDGDLNVGISSADELERFVTEKSKDGLHLSVFGVGNIYAGDERMETLADNGNGSYHAIDTVQEGRRVLVDDVMKNFIPLADDVKVQVEFNPDTVKGYRLIGYNNRRLADEDFENPEADAGEIGPGHQFTVLYEVALTDSAQEVVDGAPSDMSQVVGNLGSDWFEARIRYKAVDAKDIETLSVRGSETDLARGANDNIRKQAAVALFGEKLATGRVFAHELNKIRSIAKDVFLDEEWQGFLDLLDQYESLL